LAAAAAAAIPGDPVRAAAPGLAAANLARCHRFGAAGGDRAALRALLAGAFPAAPAEEVEAALSSIGA
ncbi:MAG TPA: hypothetical protein VFG47_22875, partial [Geminicoccaceae bacterium]|nr:hypothetical protein [Geminicoccaceae bacterium]